MRKSAVIAAVALAACGDPDPVTALFAIPGASETADFYALPFPNDLRRDTDGTLDMSLFPTNALIADQYREAAGTLDGFGLNQAVFARFDGALDPTSLQDPAGSLAEGAAVYLVDVDPESPQRGQRAPIAVRFRAEPTQTIGEHHLIARPYPGFPLAEGTTYALVITDRVRAASGGDVLAAAAFRDLVGDGGGIPVANAREVYAPLLAWLDEPGGDERANVVSATVFTTQRATTIAEALRRGVLAAPAPVATDVIVYAMTPGITIFSGNYIAPNFQSGTVPYRNAPGGRINVGGDGVAIGQRMEPMRFALSIPPGDVPANGWPIAIYAHGTGGNFITFFEDTTAVALAAQGVAVISTDQVLHGPRNPGGDAQVDFFNIANPYAMRDNPLQGTADAFAQLRLVQGLSIADGARTHRFDPTKVYFFGHSQGGSTGPGFVAFEPSVSGAVFSGTPGNISLALLDKTMPFDVPALLQTFLRDDPMDEDNPTLAMLQMWFERSDAINYAPYMVRQPMPGLAPRNIFQTEGFDDTFTPNAAMEAFATAIGGDIVKLTDTRDVPGLALRGRTIVAPPVSRNVNGVTAALSQFKQRPGSDGHFVSFDIPAAQRQTSQFLGTLANTGTATVVP